MERKERAGTKFLKRIKNDYVYFLSPALPIRRNFLYPLPKTPKRKKQGAPCFFLGGDSVTRTRYLYVANVPLYQMSYIPSHQ